MNKLLLDNFKKYLNFNSSRFLYETMPKFFYAVKHGRNPGIYMTW